MLMSLSLLGVVGLQLYWISNAIKVKQEQFNRSVNEALSRVVEKLETHEAVSMVTKAASAMGHPKPAADTVISVPPADKVHPAARVSPQKVKRASPTKPAEATTSPAVTSDPAGNPASLPGAVFPVPRTDLNTAAQQAKLWDAMAAHTISGNNLVYGAPENLKFFVGNADSLFSSKGQKAKTREKAASAATRFRHATHTSGMTVFADTSGATQLRSAGLYKEGAIYDRGQTRKRHEATMWLNNQPIRMASDTLRDLAVQLKELPIVLRSTDLQLEELPVQLHRDDFSTIEMRNDSIFIWHQEDKKQPFFSRTAKPNNDAQLWQQALALSAARPMKAATF